MIILHCHSHKCAIIANANKGVRNENARSHSCCRLCLFRQHLKAPGKPMPPPAFRSLPPSPYPHNCRQVSQVLLTVICAYKLQPGLQRRRRRRRRFVLVCCRRRLRFGGGGARLAMQPLACCQFARAAISND